MIGAGGSGSGDSRTDSETAVLSLDRIEGRLLTLVDIDRSETSDGVADRRGATIGSGNCAGERP